LRLWRQVVDGWSTESVVRRDWRLSGEGDRRRFDDFLCFEGRRSDSWWFRRILGRNELDGDDDRRELARAVEDDPAYRSRGDRRRRVRYGTSGHPVLWEAADRRYHVEVSARGGFLRERHHSITIR